MLQIISGKFFKSDARHTHHGKGILYSNVSWPAPIQTCVGTLESVDTYQEISSFVFSYLNQIEKCGRLIRIGDAEIVDQFRLLALFGLRAYFAPDRADVDRCCRRFARGATDLFISGQFVQRFCEPGLRGQAADVERFAHTVETVIGLRRERYVAVMEAFRIVLHTIQVLNYNVDLAYSMLVYCLESLAQRSDEFSPSWEDYDDKERNRLDAVLGRVDPTEADNIRVILLESGRMRVQRRFIDFVARHTADSFFVDEARGIPGALRKSALRRAARNAYIIRSQYVHALRPIVDQLRIPQVGKRDAVFWEGEPYLTLSGLLRITLHVLGTFIEQGEQVETEDHDWRSELPGVIRMELAPQYWIWNADSFGQQEAARRLSAFLRHMEDISGKDVPIVDLGALMARIEQLMPQARPCYQPAMLGLYWLYNTIVVPEARRVGWKEFIEAWRAEADKCCVEMLVVRLLVSQDIPWELDDCLKSYQEYDSRRFRKTALCLPGLFEILLLAGLANMALKAGQSQDYGELLERAILEGAGRHEIQKHLLECLTERRPVDLGSIVHWRTTHGSVR